jgi:hypothetical protein
MYTRLRGSIKPQRYYTTIHTLLENFATLDTFFSSIETSIFFTLNHNNQHCLLHFLGVHQSARHAQPDDRFMPAIDVDVSPLRIPTLRATLTKHLKHPQFPFLCAHFRGM